MPNEYEFYLTVVVDVEK